MERRCRTISFTWRTFRFLCSPPPLRSIRSNNGQSHFDARSAPDAPIGVQDTPPVLSLPRAKARYHCKAGASRLGMGQTNDAALLGIFGQDQQKFRCCHQGTGGGLGQNGECLAGVWASRVLPQLARQGLPTFCYPSIPRLTSCRRRFAYIISFCVVWIPSKTT